MKMSTISAAECSELAVRALGLGDAAVGLLSVEGLSASLRRAASFLCPTTSRQLADAVLEVTRPLSPHAALSRDSLAELVDLLLSAGDLLELRQESNQTNRLLYLGPPSYVEKYPGRYLILGIRPFGAPLVDSHLARIVKYEGHTRTIELEPEQAAVRLPALGLREVSRDRWVARPTQVAASELVATLHRRLTIAGASGEVVGLTVLDPTRRVTYYRGRWRPLNAADAGDFVARRPQAYGADLWCAVRVDNGVPQQIVDFPVDDANTPGCDEAWRLQAAIDASREEPQLFRAHPAAGPGSEVTLDLFSPVPRWVERYLQLVGTAAQRSAGALCSYRVPVGAMPALTDLLTDMLWMHPVPEGGQSDG